MEQQKGVTQIISASDLEPGRLAELEKFRRNITVLFTDIKGSTAFFEKHGDIAGLRMVEMCNNLMRKGVEEHKGRVVKTIGDSVMATFEDVFEAVRAARDMQKSLLKLNEKRAEGDHIKVRIGLHYGSGIVRSNHDVFGDVANTASRVESMAQAEQIVISDTVYEQISSSKEFETQPLGKFSLKGKEENRDLYELAWEGMKAIPVPTTSGVHLLSGGKGERVAPPAFKVQQVKQDGAVGVEKEVDTGVLTVGRGDADLSFPNDAKLAALHARFSVEGDQLFVEDLSEGLGVYLRLTAIHTLMDGDQVIMGNQVLDFHEKSQVMATAAATGTHLIEISSLLNGPVAQFVSAESPEDRYPLTEETVEWGRSKGSYTFPEDRFMSRTHCRVYQRGENFFLEDLGSRNGTFVRIRGKQAVAPGTTVRLGGQILKV